jgi:hypothetical protein
MEAFVPEEREVQRMSAALRAGRRSRRPLAIVRTSHLYLTHRSGPSDTKTIFVDIFRTAWRCIPIHARRLLCRHWRGIRKKGQFAFVSPDLLDDGSSLAPKFDLEDAPVIVMAEAIRNALGICIGRGAVLAFRLDMIELAPRAVTHNVILHELAHAYLFARDGSDASEDPLMSEIDVWEAGQGMPFTIDEDVIDRWNRLRAQARGG